MDYNFEHQVKMEYELERFNDNMEGFGFGGMSGTSSLGMIYNELAYLNTRLTKAEKQIHFILTGEGDPDEIDHNTLEYAQRFSLEIVPENIIYDKNYNMYSVNEVTVNIKYDDDYTHKSFNTPQLANEEFEDIDIKVFCDYSIINGEFEDFSHNEPTTQQSSELEEYHITLNSGTIYDWVYFGLKIGDYYIDFVTTNFNVGSFEDIIDPNN